MKFFWVVRGCPGNIFSLRPSVLSNSGLAMALGPVNCPAEVRCTTVSALRNGKFLRGSGGYSPPYPHLIFAPVYMPLHRRPRAVVFNIFSEAALQGCVLVARGTHVRISARES